MTDAFHQDIQSLVVLATRSKTLTELMPTLYDVLRRNEDSLIDVTYSYRLHATDTGYISTFSLSQGVFAQLDTQNNVDVTVTGKEERLLALFQRKLNPMTATLLGKIKITGNMAALMKLAPFL